MALIDVSVIVVNNCASCVGSRGCQCAMAPSNKFSIAGVKVLSERHPDCPLNKASYKFVKPGVRRNG